MITQYPRESLVAEPPALYPDYKSTVLRAPTRPLIGLDPTISELSGPVYGHESVVETDSDLTRQHAGEPLGERIIVSGRVTDEDGRPLPNTLIEVWQANAAGRYIHVRDGHPAPIDPNFSGAGRCVTDVEGRYTFTSVKPGAYPWKNHHNAWRPAHIHFIVGAPGFEPVTTHMFVANDPYLDSDAVFGVKDSLVVPFVEIDDSARAQELGLHNPFYIAEHEFILVNH